MARIVLLLLLIGALVLLAAVVATIVVHGGWEAGAAGIAFVSATACLAGLVVLLAAAE